MIWHCPNCRRELRHSGKHLRCSCGTEYGVLGEIPDFRSPVGQNSAFSADSELATELYDQRDWSLEAVVRAVYSRRPGWSAERIELRTSQVLQAPVRLLRDTPTWLTPLLDPGARVLDLGCGAGMLIAALHRQGFPGVGIDVSMTWLVVAQRLVREWGGDPVLAAAFGEALPLGDACMDAVVSLDVIEHVNSPQRYLAEICRVVRPAGRAILTTPNRFSLTAEPHVHVWGVGWLPRPWQAGFVRWRSGKNYDDTRLMSSAALARQLRQNTDFRFRLVMPAVSQEEIARFKALKAWLARIYNRCRSHPLLHPLLMAIGPFFRVEAQRPAVGGDGTTQAPTSRLAREAAPEGAAAPSSASSPTRSYVAPVQASLD